MLLAERFIPRLLTLRFVRCPGIVDTPFLDSIRKTGIDESHPVFANPMGRLCYPEEIADACVFLSSTMSSYVNGVALVSDGGKTVQY